MRVMWLLCALALAGCASGVGRPVHEIRADLGSDGVQHVSVTAHAFYFNPNRVVVQAAQPPWKPAGVGLIEAQTELGEAFQYAPEDHRGH